MSAHTKDQERFVLLEDYAQDKQEAGEIFKDLVKKVDSLDSTLGKVVSQQIKDHERLVRVENHFDIILREIQNIRSDSTAWLTEIANKVWRVDHLLAVLICIVLVANAVIGFILWVRS